MIKQLDRVFMDFRAIADRRDEVDTELLKRFDLAICHIHGVCHDTQQQANRSSRKWSVTPTWTGK